jgi:hypothetical protein
MSTIEEIVDHIDTTYSQWIKSGTGHNIFGNSSPEWAGTPNRGCFIRETPGGAPVWGLGGRATAIMELLGIQIICRSKFPAEAHTDVWELYTEIPAAVREATLGSTLWHSMLPTGVPSVVDQDDKQRTLYVVNFSVMKVPA